MVGRPPAVSLTIRYSALPRHQAMPDARHGEPPKIRVALLHEARIAVPGEHTSTAKKLGEDAQGEPWPNSQFVAPQMASVSNSPISNSPKRIPDCEDQQKTLGFSL